MSEAAPTVPELLSRIEELEARLSEVEGQLDGRETSGGAGYGDHRDQAVLDVLEPGAIVRLATVRKLYRKHTDITNDRTVKRRTKALLQDGPFKTDGRQSWIHIGGDDDE